MADESEVLSNAIEIAAALADKAHPAMRTLKQGMHGPVLEALHTRWKPPEL